MRAGHTTTAAQAGASVDRMSGQTGHRQIDTLINNYIRPVEVLETSTSRDLGL